MGTINGKFEKFCFKQQNEEKSNQNRITGEIPYFTMNTENYLSEKTFKVWSPNLGHLRFSQK